MARRKHVPDDLHPALASMPGRSAGRSGAPVNTLFTHTRHTAKPELKDLGFFVCGPGMARQCSLINHRSQFRKYSVDSVREKVMGRFERDRVFCNMGGGQSLSYDVTGILNHHRILLFKLYQ